MKQQRRHDLVVQKVRRAKVSLNENHKMSIDSITLNVPASQTFFKIFKKKTWR